MNVVIRSQRSSVLAIPGQRVVLIGHSLGALTALLATGIAPADGLSDRRSEALGDLPLTNLSLLLQRELAAAGVLKLPASDPIRAGDRGPQQFRCSLISAVISRDLHAAAVASDRRHARSHHHRRSPSSSSTFWMHLGSHPASRAVIVEGA